MKKILLFVFVVAFLWACNNDKEKPVTTESTPASTVDLPYTASYSSSFTDSVSDADLKTVLMSYKYWADNNMDALAGTLADTIDVDMSSGKHLHLSNADLKKLWATYRDSLSSVTIDMQAWRKMYAPDKKESSVVTWYKEIDTYKDGHADSVYLNDINMLKDGKIVWYAQYKRPAK